MRIVPGEDPPVLSSPKKEIAKEDLMAVLPPDSTEELTHGELLARLPGLGKGLYGKKTARDALKEIVPSVFSQRAEGKNVYYRRATEG